MKQLFFGRHKRDKGAGSKLTEMSLEVITRLREERLVAIHYDEIASTNSEDYTGKAAKSAMNALLKMGHEGADIMAEYDDAPDVFFLGEVEKGAAVQTGPFRANHCILKYLEYKFSREIRKNECRLPFELRPQGTLCHWPLLEPEFYRDRTNAGSRPTVNSLLPAQLEVICSEYLRDKFDAKPILPIGRTMKHFDIAAITSNSEEVLGQVTFGDPKSKVKALTPYLDVNKIFLFADLKSASGLQTDPRMTVVNIHEVFDWAEQNLPHIIAYMIRQNGNFSRLTEPISALP